MRCDVKLVRALAWRRGEDMLGVDGEGAFEGPIRAKHSVQPESFLEDQ